MCSLKSLGRSYTVKQPLFFGLEQVISSIDSIAYDAKCSGGFWVFLLCCPYFSLFWRILLLLVVVGFVRVILTGVFAVSLGEKGYSGAF